MTKPNTPTPARMETIAAYVFQNENLLRDALIMYREEKVQHCHNIGPARLADTDMFSDLYVTEHGYLSANSTSDLYKDWGSHCVYCGNNYVNRIKNINCHLHVKLVEDPSKLWIDLYNHLIPIAEAYHNDGIPTDSSTDKPPKRRPSVAAYIVQSGEKIKAATDWWMDTNSGSPAADSDVRKKIELAENKAVTDLMSFDPMIAGMSNTELSKLCAGSDEPLWINMYNALLPIAEHYHAFTNGRNAAPMDTPTTEKESPNAEAVEAPESKTTTTYICGRCDAEHTSMTSAAMCCPDVDVMHTCNKCGLHHDTRAAADYCCSSIETKHKHPDDPVLMLYACRTCGTITFDGAINNAQKIAADQHCNPMNEK